MPIFTSVQKGRAEMSRAGKHYLPAAQRAFINVAVNILGKAVFILKRKKKTAFSFQHNIIMIRLREARLVHTYSFFSCWVTDPMRREKRPKAVSSSPL